MIHIVSGYMRSGTSMMMEALMAGGMEAEYSDSREAIIQRHGDKLYSPNPGLYEVPLKEYDTTGFPLKYEGKLIKIMSWGLPGIAVHEYKIVFMLRDWEEIRQSKSAFFQKTFKDFNYTATMNHVIGICEQRKDIQLTVFKYSEVIERPLEHFAILESKGWPIDVEKATATVDPDKYRFRKEKLIANVTPY